MKILYAGDSPADGPARYLLGILTHLKAQYLHIPPGKSIPAKAMKEKWDAFILSDYSHSDISDSAEDFICKQVKGGTGLMMVGGWGSYSGPFGKWRKSKIMNLLPVRCSALDDRLQFPSGGVIRQKSAHPMFEGISWAQPPVICGMNRTTVKTTGKVILSTYPLIIKKNSVLVSAESHPLLVVDGSGKKIAALTTDLAPHWCGGLVDWGIKLRKIQIVPKVAIEVGVHYIAFVSALIRWIGER